MQPGSTALSPRNPAQKKQPRFGKAGLGGRVLLIYCAQAATMVVVLPLEEELELPQPTAPITPTMSSKPNIALQARRRAGMPKSSIAQSAVPPSVASRSPRPRCGCTLLVVVGV